MKEAAPVESKWGLERKALILVLRVRGTKRVTKMKIYISGPMTGHEDLNRPAFREVLKTPWKPWATRSSTRRTTRWERGGCVWKQTLPGFAVECGRDGDAGGIGERSSGAAAELATAKALELPVWYQAGTDLEKFMSYDRFSPRLARRCI